MWPGLLWGPLPGPPLIWRTATGLWDRHLSLPARRGRGARRLPLQMARVCLRESGREPRPPRRWENTALTVLPQGGQGRQPEVPPQRPPGDGWRRHLHSREASRRPRRHFSCWSAARRGAALYLRGRPGTAGRCGGCRWRRCGWRSPAASSGARAATCWGAAARRCCGDEAGARRRGGEAGALASSRQPWVGALVASGVRDGARPLPALGRGERCLWPGDSVTVELSGRDTDPRNLCFLVWCKSMFICAMCVRVVTAALVCAYTHIEVRSHLLLWCICVWMQENVFACHSHCASVVLSCPIGTVFRPWKMKKQYPAGRSPQAIRGTVGSEPSMWELLETASFCLGGAGACQPQLSFLSSYNVLVRF